jgi:signal transduction histidine kinase
MAGLASREKWSDLLNNSGPDFSNDLSTSPIRSQLLWATLFPLVLFGLLSSLVITTFLYQHTLDLISQRNNAQINTFAVVLSQQLIPGEIPEKRILKSAAESVGISNDAVIYLFNSQGHMLITTDSTSYLVQNQDFKQLGNISGASNKLIQLSGTNDDVMISTSSIIGTDYHAILVEPWNKIIKPVINYQIFIATLAILGIILSLATLYLAMGRIIKPIQLLAENAAGAIPGSIFHPTKVNGPQEIRTLIQAFNQMVIRLADQQSALRQYSQKALLSQEEERQRLSHELHDGILQDLVGLTQRVELCQNEITTNVDLAQERLDEIHALLNSTLDDVRRISIALRPPVLEDFGLTVAINALCKELNRFLPKLTCELIVTGKSSRLDSDLELAIYRVVQEALTNIRKHASDATKVVVELSFLPNEIIARISNDGSAFNSQDIQNYIHSGHLGLAGMYERARLFGGVFEIKSNPGENTLVSLRVPYSAVITAKIHTD